LKFASAVLDGAEYRHRWEVESIMTTSLTCPLLRCTFFYAMYLVNTCVPTCQLLQNPVSRSRCPGGSTLWVVNVRPD